VGGVLPFAAVFVEMYFIFNSIWMGQYYYVFGFLLLVFMILLITCADIAMVFCYFQLCAEDYNWWWRSFLTSGSTAGYVFLLRLVA
jgi:transmembrane 9 superfamily protein 2/4